MIREMNRVDAHRLRLRAQGLGSQRGTDVAATVRRAGAIQAQDRLGELLGVGVRTTGLTATAVNRARLDERSVVRSWLMRGTLHLVPSSDLRWMLEVVGPAMDAKALKRRADLGISADDHARVLDFLPRKLEVNGPMTRAEIAAALQSEGLPCDGQATPHLLRSTSLLGITCFGPERSGESTHVLVNDWLRPTEPPPNPGAELAKRYFSAYGPATPADFRWWSGLPGAAARSAVADISEDLVEVKVDGRSIWMLSEAASEVDEALAESRGRLRVLGPFDPYVLGYAKRDLEVPDPLLKRINAGGGMIRSCLLLDGRLVGTWARSRRAQSLKVEVTTLESLSDEATAQLQEEFEEVERFLETEINWKLELDREAAKRG